MYKGTYGYVSLMLFLGLFMTTIGCEESPVDPQVGNGTTLTATINGQSVTFDVTTAISEYDPSLNYGQFGGSTTASPIQSILVTFSGFDIDNGTYPTTLQVPDITISLVVETDGGSDAEYRCSNGGDCRVTLTASNGEVVDGTFQGTLTNQDDENDKITVTNGVFSVKLDRI